MRQLVLVCLLSASACMKHTATAPAPGQRATDQSFVDLTAGNRLRIVVPLLKSGGFVPKLMPEKQEGTTITLRADDLIGYQTLHYSVLPSRGGRVRLHFDSAEENREGNSVARTAPPELPFRLPQQPAFVRLVYFIRESQADHNMAIVSGRRREMVEAFTRELKRNPAVCGKNPDVLCDWVPPGVAVRPET